MQGVIVHKKLREQNLATYHFHVHHSVGEDRNIIQLRKSDS